MPLRAIIFFVWHFLRPTRRARARSAITLLASIVIALVVSLTLTYTSVTHSIEQKWEKQISAFWAPIRIVPTYEYKNSYFALVPLYASSRDYTPQTLGQELHYQGHPPLQRTHSDAMYTKLKQKGCSYWDWKDSFDPELDPPLPQALAHQRNTLKTHPLLELNRKIDRYRLGDPKENSSFKSLRYASFYKNIEWIEVFHSMGRWKRSSHAAKDFKSDHPSKRLQKSDTEIQHHSFILSYEALPSALLEQVDPLSDEECQRLHRILSLQERATTDINFHTPHLPLRLLNSLLELPKANPSLQQEEKKSILQALNQQPSCVILPSSVREEGMEVGDTIDLSSISQQGHITSYSTRAAIIIGFFSTEMQGWTSRSIVVSSPTGKKIYLSHPKEDQMISNHIGIWLKESDRKSFKRELEKHFTTPSTDGIPLTQWFTIESLDEYPFCRDFILQLASDRIILVAISFLILIVASSSIVSMLIILVHERRDAIAIFRVFGVPKAGITKLFALLGFFLGGISSLIGLLLGIAFLKLLPLIATLISQCLGHTLFNPIYFGKSLPTTVDPQAALWICSATTLLSLLAGSIAASYATSYKPQKLLQNQ